jgi:hypothetical protein
MPIKYKDSLPVSEFLRLPIVLSFIVFQCHHLENNAALRVVSITYQRTWIAKPILP